MTDQPQRIEFDVSAAVGEPARLAASYFPPAGGGQAPAVLVCLPGGTYDRGYFDLRVPEFDDYSFATDAAARGYAVIALDHLGTGASSRPDREIGLADQAAAAAAAVAAVPAMTGQYAPALCIAHSLGGYVAMYQQAAHGSYVGLAILGTTNQYVAQRPLGPEDAAAAESPRGRAELVERMVAVFPHRYAQPADRAPMRSWFHLADVPEQVVTVDDATTLTVVPRRSGAEASVPGIGRDAAAAVDVPVFLGYGAVDVSPDPQREASFYPNSPDITVYALTGSAHCHNMAATRRILWDRLAHWYSGVLGTTPIAPTGR
ncbi:alpha/beta fold hydrolase [Nocardia sp. BMG111209]|uniref:alpha/beta fold hydrolase n=1 Tax=Nocardia sp. BMG111209 TaxID=1160137 RepID=UPI00037E3C60|nr:alpha/beta hydrolase [Nocardia sp. BMG111209]